MAPPKCGRAAPETGNGPSKIEHLGRPLDPVNSKESGPAQEGACVAIHSWGKPVQRGATVVGYVTVTDRGWGAFAADGHLISAHRIEHHAVRAVQDHAGRSAVPR
jgi:hypothetical protein